MHTIAKAQCTHPDDKHLFVVLRQLDDNGHTNGMKYVTHIHNESDGGYAWGHYFDNLTDASIDFDDRKRQYNAE